MKKNIILLTVAAAMCYLGLQGSAAGGAFNSGADGTFATGTTNGCTCHNSSPVASTTVVIELDSAGIPVTNYVAGQSYTIKLTGTNTGTTSLPKFGFQITAVKAAGAGTASAVNAGVMQSTGLPSGDQYTTAASSGIGIDVVEHNMAITATTGTGATGTTYVRTINWTAPATGSGVVKLYGCINAVNGTGGTGGDKWNIATSVSITEEIIAAVSPITGTFSLCAGTTTTLSDASTPGTWSSGATGIATIVSTSGLVTGVSGGTATITYTTASGSVTQVITVNPLPSAGTITGSSTVCQGATTTLADAAGTGVWSSSNTAIATISAGGVVSGVAAGSATITYTVTNACGTATTTHPITVNPLPAAGTITGASVFCNGTTITLTDAMGGGTWSSGTPAVATVGATTGVVTGVAAGIANITYTVTNACGSATASHTVTVEALSAGTITGAAGLCVGATTSLTDAISGGNWTSSNTAVAGVGAGTGVVNGVAVGTATISYTVTNSCGTSSATQVVTVSVPPTVGAISGSSTFCQGSTATMTDPTPGGVWSTSVPAIATIGGTSGVATGVSGGSVNILYTVTNSCGSTSSTLPVTINPLPSAGTIVGAAAFCLGTTTSLADAIGGGTWNTGNAGVATVNTSGVVSSVAAGTALISYTTTNICGSATTTQIVTVDILPPSVAISGATIVCQAATTTLTDVATGGVWSSSNTGIAVVGAANGIVGGIAGGTVNINYTINNSCGTMSATQAMTVNPLPIAGTITGASAFCLGSSTSLSDGIAGGTWSSSNVSIASVNGTGMVTGLAAGNAIITYTTTNSCGVATTTHSITIDILPSNLTISGPSLVCLGSMITLTDAAAGGTWSSANPAIATIGLSNGVVAAVSVGVDVVTYKVTNTCGSVSKTDTLNVAQLPNPGSIAGPNRVCVGSPIMLTDAMSGGIWSSGNNGIATAGPGFGLVQGVSAGTTNISYAVSNLCGSAYAVHSVTVYALPTPTFTSVGDTLFSTLTYPSYQWILNGVAIVGATYPTYLVTHTGKYTLQVTDVNGCTDTSAVDSFVDVSVRNTYLLTKFRIYPNPAQSVIFIDAPAAVDAQLTAMDGRLLAYVKEAGMVDMSTLPNGIYFITLFDHQSGDKIKTEKIVRSGN